MSKTKVPRPEPATIGRSRQAEFLMAVMNMSWQLAIVVLLPIFGGYKLDQHFSLSPVFTILGLVLAMLGTAMVLWRQLQLLGPPPKVDTGRRS